MFVILKFTFIIMYLLEYHIVVATVQNTVRPRSLRDVIQYGRHPCDYNACINGASDYSRSYGSYPLESSNHGQIAAYGTPTNYGTPISYGVPINYGTQNSAYASNANYGSVNMEYGRPNAYYGNAQNTATNSNYGTWQISFPVYSKFPTHIQIPYPPPQSTNPTVVSTTAATTILAATTISSPSSQNTVAVGNYNITHTVVEPNDLSNVPLLFCNNTHKPSFRRHLPFSAKENGSLTMPKIKLPLVLPILYGDFHNQGNRLAMYPSVVLVIDESSRTRERKFIVVDTGLSHLKDSVVSGLLAHGVEPSMVDTVIITHPDTDTMGNLNLFPCAQIFASNRISKENLFIERTPPTFNTNRSDLPFHALFDNTEIYLTPGFGLQDQSLLVHNVENHGTVAIVGKLVLNQTDLASSDMAIREFATDDVEQRKLWQATRREIICLADYLIPGHGIPFQISEDLKRLAECPKRPKRNSTIRDTIATIQSSQVL